MAPELSVVAVSGSLSEPSKTTVLLEALVQRIGEHLPIRSRVISLHEVGPAFAGVLSRNALPPEAEDALRAVEEADVLVVGSPVFRASFTGLFKHFFDFVDQHALVDVPVLLAASGGSERHALIIEHQFRPLFSFFQATTLPLGVYAHQSDFTGYEITGPLLLERIDKTVRRALPILRASAQWKDDRDALEPAVNPAAAFDGVVRLLS